MPLPVPPSTAEMQQLITAARTARSRAYAPYSNFQVGAALLLHDGRVVLGCNVENAQAEVTICAERNAIGGAVTLGALKNGRDFIRAVAVTVGSTSATRDHFAESSPCGACRQVMNDFSAAGQSWLIVDDGGAGFCLGLHSLLPQGFRFGRENSEAAQFTDIAALEAGPQADLLAVAQAAQRHSAGHVLGEAEGAAIKTRTGKVYAGAWVENSCTPLSMPALQVAINRAVAAGEAQNGPHFIAEAVMTFKPHAALKHEVNPALIAEFFAPDARLVVVRE